MVLQNARKEEGVNLYYQTAETILPLQIRQQSGDDGDNSAHTKEQGFSSARAA